MSSARVALSPKKVRSSNILPTPDCATSPTKRLRTSRPSTPSRRAHTSSTPIGSARPLTAPTTSPRVGLPPFKVLTDDTVYSTDIDTQLNENKDLILPPPLDASLSPSPRKREFSVPRKRRTKVLTAWPTTTTPKDTTSETWIDPLSSRPLSFLTPPRPRLTPTWKKVSVDEDRLLKSASPTLGRSSLQNTEKMTQSIGFTLYLDQCEYFAIIDTSFEHGEDVDKENQCPCRATS